MVRGGVLAWVVCLLIAWGPAVAAPADEWILWSQHRAQTGMWWRAEAGPFSADKCRVELRKASGHPKVGMTKWYDVAPAHLEKLYGRATPITLGTWVSCWPAGFDFDRDLVDK